MSGVLLLFGLAISAFTIGGLFEDNSPSENTGSGEELPDDPANDFIVDSEFEILLTEQLGLDGVENVEFVDGPLDIDTASGNDFVVAGSGDDTLVLGSGNDAATGGAGDDMVDLGSGDDAYGSEAMETSPDPIFGETDLGDDTVFGGDGDDVLSDLLGSNVLNGGDGDDFLQAIDSPSEEGVTADQLDGGNGDDTFVVDQGDVVVTGSGNDDVRIVLGDGSAAIEGSEIVTIEDFDIDTDVVQLGGQFETEDLSIVVSESSDAATIFWNDTAVVLVKGGQELTIADILIAS